VITRASRAIDLTEVCRVPQWPIAGKSALSGRYKRKEFARTKENTRILNCDGDLKKREIQIATGRNGTECKTKIDNLQTRDAVSRCAFVAA
jgi:hypothetical protein